MFLAENVIDSTRKTWEGLAHLIKNAEHYMLEAWAVEQHWRSFCGLSLGSGVKSR